MNEQWQRRVNWFEFVIRATVCMLIAPWVLWYLLWTTAGTEKGLKFYFGKFKGWVLEPLNASRQQ